MKYFKHLLFVFVLVFLDQLSKFYFKTHTFYFFKYFSLQFTSNTGIAFGFFKNYNFLFIVLIVLILLYLFYLFKEYPRFNLAFYFIISGAFGNLIDRIFRGYVIDFIDFKIWPVFNLADSFVTFGVFLLLYYFWKDER